LVILDDLWDLDGLWVTASAVTIEKAGMEAALAAGATNLSGVERKLW
jgi:hypothetical protein